MGLVFHATYPAQFHVLIWCSVATVFAAAVIFSLWAVAQGPGGDMAAEGGGGGGAGAGARGGHGGGGSAALSDDVVHLQAKTRGLEHRLAQVELLLRQATAGKSPQKGRAQLTGL